MSDDNGEEEEEEGPLVELGEGESVEGAPVVRIASRLHWPMQRSEIQRKEGESVIRTPDGPRTLATVLEDVDITYFERRQEFVDAVREAVGPGPIPTDEA